MHDELLEEELVDRQVVGALAPDHLVDHPDGVLVARITANTHTQPPTRKDPS